MAKEVLAGFSYLQKSPMYWRSACVLGQGIFEDCSLPACSFLQAQITAKVPSHQSFASTTCRIRLQGKGQNRIAPKTAGQQGNRQETTPEAPLQSLGAEKT